MSMLFKSHPLIPVYDGAVQQSPAQHPYETSNRFLSCSRPRAAELVLHGGEIHQNNDTVNTNYIL